MGHWGAVASAPAFTFLVARLRGDRQSARAWLGMLVALVGSGSIAVAGKIDLGSALLPGNLLVLCAAVAWAIFTALNAGLAQRAPPR